jgi:hypothetical protein
MSTQQVVELARAVSTGQDSWEQLGGLLESRISGFVSVRDHFEKESQAQGAEFLECNAELVDAVRQGFLDYADGLDLLNEGLTEQGSDKLRRGADLLESCTPVMLEAMQTYGQAYLEFGESAYPIVNVVDKLSRAVEDGRMTGAQAKATLVPACQHYQVVLTELANSELGSQPGFLQKADVARTLLDVIAELEARFESNNGIEFELRERFVQSLERWVEADRAIFESGFLSGPTAVPAANLLINVAQRALDEKAQPDDVADAVRWYRAFLARLEDSFELATAGQTQSSLILEELPRTRENLDLQEELLDEFEELLAGQFDEEAAEALIERFQVLIEGFNETAQVYVQVAERESQVVCVGCNRSNPAVNRICEQCGAQLPRFFDANFLQKSSYDVKETTDDDVTEEILITQNLYRLYEACYSAFEGKISPDEFLKVLDWNRGLLADSESNVAAFELPVLESENEEERQALEENRETAIETLELFREGLASWREGLDQMEQFISDGRRSTLENGIHLVWSGYRKVSQVQKIGEIAQRTKTELEQQLVAEAQAAQAAPPVLEEPELE